jgi:hypothetical protein
MVYAVIRVWNSACDLGLLFDALSHFEESLLAAKLAAAGDEDGELPTVSWTAVTWTGYSYC